MCHYCDVDSLAVKDTEITQCLNTPGEDDGWSICILLMHQINPSDTIDLILFVVIWSLVQVFSEQIVFETFITQYP